MYSKKSTRHTRYEIPENQTADIEWNKVTNIQSYQQLEKNYGREGAAIVQDNCQITIAGGFAPSSETADIISKALGTCTVMTGSVSRSKNDPLKACR